MFLTQFSDTNVYSFSSEFDELGEDAMLPLTVRQVVSTPPVETLRKVLVASSETQPLPGIMGVAMGVSYCKMGSVRSQFS